MVRSITRTVAIACGVVGAMAIGVAQERSIEDGVYTAEQAARGRQEYRQQCATCHATNLQGGEMAPSLVGQYFLGGWGGQTLWSLADFTYATMPQDNPATLTSQALNDILAFILEANEYPAGDEELALDLDQQDDSIVIE